MSLADYFGDNLGISLIMWIRTDFQAELKEKFGEDFDTTFGLVIVCAGTVSWWLSVPRQKDDMLLRVGFGNEDKIVGPEGLLANVDHKLNFVFRTGLDSSEARTRPDLCEPGDFPWEGAGTYRGYVGGVSAFKEETDWWVFRRVIDKLIELRTPPALAAQAASKKREPGMKYMGG